MEPDTFSHSRKQYQASDRSRSSASRDLALRLPEGDRSDTGNPTKYVTVESDLVR